LIKFEERAVAFIDVLGFKALVGKSVIEPQSLAQLAKLITLLDSAVPTLDAGVSTSVPERLIPKHLYISDCIILSAPLTDSERTSYNGVHILVMRSIQISQLFLEAGYLVRGGISVGQVWHSKHNIVGPAYQEACELEKKADLPRIVLSSSSAKNHWTGVSRAVLDDEGTPFVNPLFDYYIPNNTEPGVVRATYDRYENLAVQRLSEELPDSAKRKWEWFAEFVKKEAPHGSVWGDAMSGRKRHPKK
jgi:hypothetical protein